MQGRDPFIELTPVAEATGARKELYDDLERVRGKGHVSNLFKAYGAFPELGIANFKRLTVLLSQGTLSCLLYTSPSPRDATLSRMPSSA